MSDELDRAMQTLRGGQAASGIAPISDAISEVRRARHRDAIPDLPGVSGESR